MSIERRKNGCPALQGFWVMLDQVPAILTFFCIFPYILGPILTQIDSAFSEHFITELFQLLMQDDIKIGKFMGSMHNLFFWTIPLS